MRYIIKAVWIRIIRHIFTAKSKTRPSNLEGQFDATQATKPLKPTTIVGRAFIVDGDTLSIKGTQIRLFGIDAPELGHPFGQKAKWALVSLCKDQQVYATITDVDTYGRTVARCQLEDGRDISAEMVRMGMALDWSKYSNGAYAELEHRGIRKKLWLADARQKGRIHTWKKYEVAKRDREIRNDT